MRRIVLLKLFLLLFSTGIALIVAEIFLSMFRPQITLDRLKSSYDFPCFEKSPYLYLKLKKNQMCVLKSNFAAFPDVAIKTNSLGLRNPEVVLPKPINTKRILFLGDSFTLGWGVEEADTYVRKTQDLLQKQLPNVAIEAINAGINATGPTYDYVYLKKEGFALDSDVVVVGFYPWQDILFDVYGSEIVTQKDAFGYPDAVDSKAFYVDYSGVLRQKNLPIRLQVPMLRRSHVFSLMAQAISPLSIKSESDFLPLLPSRLFLVCLFKKNCTDLDDAKKTTKELMLAMRTLTDQHHVKLLVAMIPAEFQVYDDVNQKHAIPIPLSRSERIYPHAYFSQLFEENSIEYIDLLPVLTQYQGKRTYFERDDHWNADGHMVAAEAIRDALVKILTQ